MARRNKKQQSEDLIVDLNEVGGTAQDFFERNQRIVIGIATGLLIVIGGIWAFQNFYKAPRETEAMEQMSRAEYYFEQDSFAKAIDNPGGGFPGFAEVSEDYGSTKAGNLALYYAGVSYLQLGRYAVAADYLRDFNPVGKITPALKFGALGDCYSEVSEIQDMSKAIDLYKKAANATGDDFTGPYYSLKAAMLSESQGKYKDALDMYRAIQVKYPDSDQAANIERYIARAQAALN